MRLYICRGHCKCTAVMGSRASKDEEINDKEEVNTDDIDNYDALYTDQKDEKVGKFSKTSRPSHTNQLSSIHTSTFFTAATIFNTVFHMGENFHHVFFTKIVKIFVVLEGL